MRQELAEDVGGGVGVPFGRKELGEVRQVVASGDQWQLGWPSGAQLTEPHSGRESVANAFAAEGLFGAAAFAEIIVERLGGTAVADRAIGFAVGVAQVAKIADAGTLLVDHGVREGLLDLGHFEGEAGG